MAIFRKPTTTTSLSELARALFGRLSICAFAVLGAACARSAQPAVTSPPQAQAAPAEPAAELTPAHGAKEPVAPPPHTPPPLDPGLAERVSLWLPHLYGALHELAAGQLGQHVRIAWFGDSHTAADFWSGDVREELQARFGDGGPGLVLLGRRNYRHDRAQLATSGGWRAIPRTAAATWLQADGIFGLAGLGAVPTDDESSVMLQLGSGAVSAAPLRFELLYRLPHPQSTFRVQIGDEPPRQIQRGQGQPRSSGLESVELTARASSLTLSSFAGEPEFFGVVIEETSPGVVLDTLGINGARAATPLSWNAGAWTAEVAARRPDLVILAYGTNEVGDTAAPSEYEAHYSALLERIRAGAPDAECLLVGPTDRVAKNWVSEPRVLGIDRAQRRIAENLGCAFFSTLEAMGGPGSLRRWAFSNPQLARRDRVHLRPLGYRRLARALLEQIFSSYDTCYPDTEPAP